MVKINQQSRSPDTFSRIKVFVGLSGGVDSSVAAALLKKRGYEVTGVFIKIWSPEWFWCSSADDRLDAMRVCAHLDIPFREIDLTDEYKKEVVSDMINEYRAGRTPNPDVVCNRIIKFGRFFDFAIKEGVDLVATGHYARVAAINNRLPLSTGGKRKEKREKSSVAYKLLMSADAAKDQTYFLWTLTQRELARVLFPIGHLTKPVVRKLAKKFGLPTAEKKDSQGLCFMGPIGMKEFLGHYLKPRVGDVLDESGQVIGRHEGAFFLTIGARHGFTIFKKPADSRPYYVVSKDMDRNTVTVSNQPAGSRAAARLKICLRSVNFIRSKPRVPEIFQVRYRYRAPLVEAKLIDYEPEKKIATFQIAHSGNLPASGQSMVFYRGNECAGGGIIL